MNLIIRLLNLGFTNLLLLSITVIVPVIYTPLQAQEIEPTLVSISDGLISPNVQDIIQDRYGLLWIATINGLQKYDGYRFETFKNIPGNASSLLHNNVWGLLEDQEGNIWASTDKGISKFNRQKRAFTNYDLATQFKVPDDGVYTVFNLFQDSQGRLWATTLANELIAYDPQSDKWSLAKYETDNTESANSHPKTRRRCG